jgi:hypothetical protein
VTDENGDIDRLTQRISREAMKKKNGNGFSRSTFRPVVDLSECIDEKEEIDDDEYHRCTQKNCTGMLQSIGSKWRSNTKQKQRYTIHFYYNKATL